MHRSLALVMALSLQLVLAREASAAETDDEPRPVQPEQSATPAGLLAAADAAVGADDLELARSLFERLAAEFPDAPEANEARRALKIIGARVPPAAHPPSPTPSPVPATTGTGAAEPDNDDDVVNRNEPYSRRTSERLRLNVWEKVDFGVTAFIYGMSVGVSFALSQSTHNTSPNLTPVALGAVAYTIGAVGFLKALNPDRGDLPLALAITSYVPITTLLVLGAADAHADAQTTGTATAVASLLSLPIAAVAAQHLNLDPGDTQLVRDAGFWGLALTTLGTLGFGGSTVSEPYGYSYHQAPSGRKVAVAGLVGLYGGLGLGLLGAHVSDISLERVRVTTWGGYGGAVVGLLMSAAFNDSREPEIYQGATIGALAGLVLTFLTTSSLDGIPDESSRPSSLRRLTPTMVQVVGTDGRIHSGLGLGGTLF